MEINKLHHSYSLNAKSLQHCKSRCEKLAFLKNQFFCCKCSFLHNKFKLLDLELIQTRVSAKGIRLEQKKIGWELQLEADKIFC